MPQIGWFELLIIVIIAILVIGPKDFPIVLNKIGHWVGSIKRFFSEVQNNVTRITDIEDEKTENPQPMDIKPNSAARDQDEGGTFRRYANQEHQLEPLDQGNNYEQRFAVIASGSEYMKELDAQVKSMIEKSKNMIQVGNQRKTAEICKVCGKEGLSQTIKDHIEANHLEGVSIPCNFCEKTFRSRRSLVLHKSQNHE